MQAINQNADCAVKSAECSVLNIMCSEHCVICTVSTNVKICLMQPRQCTECNVPFVEQVVRKIFQKKCLKLGGRSVNGIFFHFRIFKSVQFYILGSCTDRRQFLAKE